MPRFLTLMLAALAVAASNGCCLHKGYILRGDWSLELNRLPFLGADLCGESCEPGCGCGGDHGYGPGQEVYDAGGPGTRFHPVPTSPAFHPQAPLTPSPAGQAPAAQAAAPVQPTAYVRAAVPQQPTPAGRPEATAPRPTPAAASTQTAAPSRRNASRPSGQTQSPPQGWVYSRPAAQ